MIVLARWSGLCMVGALVVAGCATPAAAPGRGAQGGRMDEPAAPATPKRITAAITEDLPAINEHVSRATAATTTAGGQEVERLLNAGLTVVDPSGEVLPELAQAAPTVENGLWKVLADGRMETTWTIRPGATWHDGAPFTSADLVFTATLWQDRELAIFRHVAFDLVEGVDAADGRTVTVRWKRPYIYADTMFTIVLAPPVAKHALEQAYAEEKANFVYAPYWGDQYVGTGAFKLKEWVKGSHLLLQANDGYVLGKPKLDEIEVKIMPDPNTLLANVLAGTVQLGPLHRGLSLEQAVQMREQWRDGKADVAADGWVVIFPQFIDASPPIVANLQFRRALMHAMDRQEMVDTVQHGLVPIADSYISPKDPEFAVVDRSVMKYEYDPRKAAQMIEALGYTRGPDGFFRDGSGQRLVVEHRTLAGWDIMEKVLLSSADYWQKVGVAVEQVIYPQQLHRDPRYVATFPAFYNLRQSKNLDSLRIRHSTNTALPENRFVGQNYSRYMSPEFDALIDRYFTTIPKQERLEGVRDTMKFFSEQLPFMPTFFDTNSILVSNRVQNVTNAKGFAMTQAWNGHLWDVGR